MNVKLSGFLLFFSFFLNHIFLFGQSYQWAKSVGGGSDDIGSAIALDSLGNTYILGAFYGTADLDPGPGVFNLTTNGLGDAFILKLNISGYFVRPTPWMRLFNSN